MLSSEFQHCPRGSFAVFRIKSKLGDDTQRCVMTTARSGALYFSYVLEIVRSKLPKRLLSVFSYIQQKIENRCIGKIHASLLSRVRPKVKAL